MEDRWAYMVEIVAPGTRRLAGNDLCNRFARASVRRILLLERGQGITNGVSLLALVALLGIRMIVACARRWLREYAGLGKSLTTFAVSFGIVAVYYGILVAWFWQMFPVASASK